MAKYGPMAKKNIGKELHEFKHHHKYKSREQAIAVGIKKTQEKGGKAPYRAE